MRFLRTAPTGRLLATLGRPCLLGGCLLGGCLLGLGRLPGKAKAFYGAIACATLIGMFINFVSIDPIKALFWTAVINGVVAVPLMIVMMIMTANPKVMGDFTLSRPVWLMGWLATLVMAATVLAMAWTMVF